MWWMLVPMALAQNTPAEGARLSDIEPAASGSPSDDIAGEGVTEAESTDYYEEEYDEFVVPGTGPNIVMPEVTDIEWQWPLYGRVSSHYGQRIDPRRGGKTFHHGVDIAAAPGRRVKAAGVGVVSYAGRGGGYGNLVEVRHPDGHITRYAHMTQLLVRAGDQVQAGDPVGTVGNTGRSTGPHLHFEFRKDRKTEDPAVIAIIFGEPVDAQAQQKAAVLRAPAVPGSPLEEALRDGLTLMRQLLTLALAPFV